MVEKAAAYWIQLTQDKFQRRTFRLTSCFHNYGNCLVIWIPKLNQLHKEHPVPWNRLYIGLYTSSLTRSQKLIIAGNIVTSPLTNSMKQTSSWESNSHSLKKYPAFYETRRLVTVITPTVHWTLSWAKPVESGPHPHNLRPQKSILIASIYV